MRMLERCRVAAFIIFGLGGGLPAAAADEAAAAGLVFEEQLDGKCQILSAGGKLVVLRNAHPDRAVRYRLVRMFHDVPQGRIDGTIGPGETPQKLGCNRVNGRRQFWRVERAAFMNPSDEKSP